MVISLNRYFEVIYKNKKASKKNLPFHSPSPLGRLKKKKKNNLMYIHHQRFF